MRHSSRNAFTVIELITVLAIVAILMAVLTPAVSNMLATARRSSDANNLRQLAMSTIAHINEAGATKSMSFTNVNEWAVALAQAGNFNEPALFFAQGDAALPTTLPVKIHTSGTVDATFASCPVSVSAAKTLNLNGSAASTPIVWTRGLQADHTWSTTAPYGTKGGYVAFLDGHVAFYKQLPSQIDLPSVENILERGATVVTP